MRTMTLPRGWLIAGLLAVMVLAGIAPAEAEWRGEEVVRDGVTHVLNPAEPVRGVREIELSELWRLGGEVEDEEAELFGIVSSVFADEEGNIYLLDSQLSEIKVYKPDGELLRTMGRPGEGPGEFVNAADANLLSDGRIAVAQVFPGKAILFNPNGTPAGELPLQLDEDPSVQTFLVLMELDRVGEYIGTVCMNQIFGGQTITQQYMLALFDLDGKLVRKLLEFGGPVDMSQGYPINEAESARLTRRWAAGPDGTIFTPYSFSGYQIHVFDPAGELRLVIEREYEPVPRTAEELQRVEEIFAGFTRGAPNPKLTIEKNHNDIDEILVRPDGTLWVMTSRGRWRAEEGSLGTYDVFDAAGRFIEQVDLRGPGDPREDGVYVIGDRVIVIGSLMSSVVAAVGGVEGGEEEAATEEGVTIICYGM